MSSKIYHSNDNLVLKRKYDGVVMVNSLDGLMGSPFSLHNILNLPCSVYFDNTEHKAEIVNDTCAMVCGFESTQDAIGRSVFDFATKDSATRSVINQKEIIATQRIKIIEDLLVRKDDFPITFIGISFPWYSVENKVIGVFGCSIVLEHHSVAKNLNKLYELGLLSNQPLTQSSVLDCYFTPRETQCIHFIKVGKSPKAIAKILGLSYRTVEHYIANIKSKMLVSTHAELMAKLNDLSNEVIPSGFA